MDRVKQITKNTIIITIGKVFTQFFSFLLLPLYTAILSTGEYGIVDFILTVVHLLVPIASLMVDQGTFRYLLEAKTEEDKNKVITNSFIIILLLNSIVAFIYIIVSFFTNYNYSIWLITILFITILNNLLLQIARGEKKVSVYSLGCFFCSSLIIVLNILFLVVFKAGILGMLISTFMGNLLTAIFLFLKLEIYKNLNINNYNTKLIKKIVKYSIPLVPNELSIWLMNGSDKIIITLIIGASANGIISIAHKFPSIFMTFFNIFMLAWHESAAVHYLDKDRDEFFSSIMNVIIKIFSSLCILIILVIPFVFKFLIDNSFAEAYYNIPIYMCGTLLNVVIGTLGAVYVANKKTTQIVKTTIIAGIINVITNILLIKPLGLYAAAISTFIGYLVAMVYRIIDTRKYINIHYDIKTYLIISILLTSAIIGYYLTNVCYLIVAFMISILVIIYINSNVIKKLLQILKGFRRNNNEKII